MNDNNLIKQSITMYDVLDRCGLHLDRNNAMCCPLHHEKTPSFKVYKDGTRFHCFGCDTDGDVITFVMLYYSLNYRQAIMHLASDFSLPITGTRPPTVRDHSRATREWIRTAEERRAKVREAEEREREHITLFDAYSSACDELTRLEGNLIMYKPKTVTEPFNELYCEALHKLPYQRYKCEMLQIVLQNFNARGKVKRADERASTEEKAIEWDGVIQ